MICLMGVRVQNERVKLFFVPALKTLTLFVGGMQSLTRYPEPGPALTDRICSSSFCFKSCEQFCSSKGLFKISYQVVGIFDTNR